jgi:hypothetical protein
VTNRKSKQANKNNKLTPIIYLTIGTLLEVATVIITTSLARSSTDDINTFGYLLIGIALSIVLIALGVVGLNKVSWPLKYFAVGLVVVSVLGLLYTINLFSVGLSNAFTF